MIRATCLFCHAVIESSSRSNWAEEFRESGWEVIGRGWNCGMHLPEPPKPKPEPLTIRELVSRLGQWETDCRVLVEGEHEDGAAIGVMWVTWGILGGAIMIKRGDL